MNKKNKSNSKLGRSLIKDRFGNKKDRKMVSDNSMLHTTEIQDGYDWGRLNLQSVTEESSFQEFLSTAELAGTDFQAEKLNIKFVNPRSNVGLLTKEELNEAKDAHKKYKSALKIPRRPPWDAETTPDELDKNEKETFLEWRRSLAILQEEHGIVLTPYEKNLEFWRQLWRVVERSDVIVQIVDARNPLLFRCEDLESYVKEVSPNKMNLILVNKADFLSDTQRQVWGEYFNSNGVEVAFYSAHLASLDPSENEEEIITKLSLDDDTFKKPYPLLTREELIGLLRTIHTQTKVTPNVTTVGLVGYPNVGKSSTINSLLCDKKVSVSATPGKTKHFQTHYLDKDILLCDCPGLVMPSFVFSKAEMILNGILPIDQMRDHVPPTNLLTSLIPRHVIEDRYGIMIPKPLEGEDPNRDPTAEELLNAYAYNRGFMTANGQPDNSRAARYILKDYMNGKLLYCHAPPNINQKEYHTWIDRQNTKLENQVLPPRAARAVRPYHATTEDIDKQFFKSNSQGIHAKGIKGLPNAQKVGPSTNQPDEKPWKQHNKHKNKGKKEKLRRVYAHLDQH
ncbi:large subunit GTPase 1 homolog [Diorhabda sublineata]|uniref:large subunit GTPase 1 homolog n=1 Tax=Diorhabda sublineata TaxID=1163346 RepID=UPI0024E12477|nr:large subunit GTPase 1 homolog [Diorhabda sublineata]